MLLKISRKQIIIKNFLAFFQEFFQGGRAKSIVMQISFDVLLFSNQISGGGKSLRGKGKVPQVTPPSRATVEESQLLLR